MAQDTETFNSELYDLLKVRGYKPVPLNSQNQRVGASQQADVMEFTFTKDGDDYGKAWISVDDASNLKVYFDDEQQDSPDTKTPGVDYDDTWTGLLKHLKGWAQRRQLSFELSNKDRLGDDMRQRDYYKMKEKLGESYHPMGKKASYNDAVPNVKIVLQHNRALEEGEQRYRNVARIFLENQDGERFLAPTTRPGIARVYARHIAEGGLPNDERWNHIKTVCEDYNKMAGFVRATRNGQFNESAQELVNEGINHYNNLRETLKKMTGHRGYHAYFESWTPTLMEGDGEDLSEMFMSQSLDPRIESAMPILSRLKKPVTEMEEVDNLAEWADDIISEKLDMDSTTKSLAVPADEMLDEAPGAETLSHNQSTEKKNLKAFGLAEEGPEEPPIGKGKNAYIVTDTTGKKVTVLADHDWQAKETAKEHWKMPSTVGLMVKPKSPSAPTAPSAPTSKTPLDTAANKATGSEEDNPEQGQDKNPSTWSRVKDAVKKNWNVPGGNDSYGGAAKAIAGMFEGDVVPFKKKDEDDDDSWMPSEEDFEQEEKHRNRKRTPANDVNEMDKERGSKRDFDNAKGPDKTAKMMAAKKAMKDARKALDKAFKGDVEENFIGMAPQAVAEEEVEEARTKKVNVEVTDKGAVYVNDTRITGRHTKWGIQNTIFQAKVPLDQVVQTLRDNGFGNIRLDPQYSAEMGITLEEDLGPEQKRVGQLGPTEKVKNNNIGKLVGASESTEIDPELARIMEIAGIKTK